MNKEFIVSQYDKDQGFSDEFVRALDMFIKENEPSAYRIYLINDSVQDQYRIWMGNPHQIIGIRDTRWDRNEQTVKLYCVGDTIDCKHIDRIEWTFQYKAKT